MQQAFAVAQAQACARLIAQPRLGLVVAVPSMDFLTGNLGDGNKALITSTTDPVTTGTGAAGFGWPTGAACTPAD